MDNNTIQEIIDLIDKIVGLETYDARTFYQVKLLDKINQYQYELMDELDKLKTKVVRLKE